MKDDRRTKIVATIGPATWEPDQLKSLVLAGVDVFRINFSHANYERFKIVVDTARQLSQELRRPVGVLGDLQGPKIRTGKLKDGAPVMLTAGETCTITTRPVEGTAELLSTTYTELPRDVKTGDRILLSDGTRVLEVLSTTDTDIKCRVVIGGKLGQHQGINLPGSEISAPALTEKDIADLDICLKLPVDYIALSFVRRPEDVTGLRERIRSAGHDVPIISKIEKPQALECIAEIIDVSDAIMVARGDLGVEMSAEQVPLEQKKLIALCNYAGKPVITATQMLESMVHNATPTRAEASDVANAIFDGTDAVMLSAETAVGEYPATAVKTMATIAKTVEQASFAETTEAGGSPRWQRHYDLAVKPTTKPRESMFEAAAADAAVSAAQKVKAAAIVVYTTSGSAAMAVSSRRPFCPIYALTPAASAYNRLSLVWGIEAFQTPLGQVTDQILAVGEEKLVKRGKLAPGDTIVIVSGTLPLRGATNVIKIQTIGA